MKTNPILKTDSYKVTHWNQYQEDTQRVYSYFESRPGAKYDSTIFFGLQYIIEEYLMNPFTLRDIDEAEALFAFHLGDKSLFNRAGWEYVLDVYNGYLPVQIKAVAEGTVVPVGNVLMTVENNDPSCFWLTNYVESLLTHVWYPSTVATLSYSVKQMMLGYLEDTGDPANINFMLHDFGYRGATTDEAAAIGGAGHLINFMGTDTIVAMELAHNYYNADYASLAFSVPATEHSVMTSLGREGEYKILDQLLENHPTGILSVVSDSYDIYAFVDEVIARKDQILARDGRFVVRPDSVTPEHDTPESLVVNILTSLMQMGGEYNSKGYFVLDDHIRVLWGDGIDAEGIEKILSLMMAYGFSADNIVFGMGGGLLQKVNRDTQRFAFKCSAQKRGGMWYDIQKSPLDASKKSKAGRLALVERDGELTTVRADIPFPETNLLDVVYTNGYATNLLTFDEIRENAR